MAKLLLLYIECVSVYDDDDETPPSLAEVMSNGDEILCSTSQPTAGIINWKRNDK